MRDIDIVINQLNFQRIILMIVVPLFQLFFSKIILIPNKQMNIKVSTYAP